MPCLTAKFDVGTGPIINVGIALPGTYKPSEAPKAIFMPALIDTGASGTCISADAAINAGLSPFGKAQMTSASETRAMNTYLADLYLPFGDPTKSGGVTSGVMQNMRVMEFNHAGPHFQVLLGRDIIGKGLFQMIGYDGRLTLCL